MDIYQLLYDVINCIIQEIISLTHFTEIFLRQWLSWAVSKGVTHWSTDDGGQGGGGREFGGGAGEGGRDPVVDEPPRPLVHVILRGLDIQDRG